MTEIVKKILEDIAGMDISHSNNFFNDGLLDSFDLISLVEEIEQAFEIIIQPEEIIKENFKDIVSLISLIQRSETKL